ncbi:STAS domain-containing protein [Actinoplanes sp. NPDC049681]|uniref:STAS domain-containing protein n=1 Tax=Actinoplanes sp. NPDC049681 TaxID=3363905 RepID=UPI0037A82261
MGANAGVPPPELHFGPVVRHSDSIELSVEGDIDMTTGDRFTQALADIVDEPGVRRIALDVGRLHFIDSNGVTALIKTHWAARERGIVMTVQNAGGPIREILEMLGVYDLLTAERL